MKKIKFLFVIAIAFTSLNSVAQEKQNIVAQNFQGAKASKKVYKVVYQLNTEDDKKITSTLKNISNALQDPRLEGKLKVELVVHGGGVFALKKGSVHEVQLRDLQKKGVIIAQCERTLKTRNVAKEELFDFVSFVPTGNGELIIRQVDGWAIIHP